MGKKYNGDYLTEIHRVNNVNGAGRSEVVYWCLGCGAVVDVEYDKGDTLFWFL